jgi:hypothetical protein
MTTTVRTITTDVLKRDWADIEPKLLAFGTTGCTAALIVEVGNYAGFTVQPALAVLLSTVIGLIAGYVKSSTAKTSVAAAPAILPAIVAPVFVPPIVPPVVTPTAFDALINPAIITGE